MLPHRQRRHVQFAWFNFAIVYFSGVFVIRPVSFRTRIFISRFSYSKATMLCSLLGSWKQQWIFVEWRSLQQRPHIALKHRRINKKIIIILANIALSVESISAAAHTWSLAAALCHRNWNLWAPESKKTYIIQKPCIQIANSKLVRFQPNRISTRKLYIYPRSVCLSMSILSPPHTHIYIYIEGIHDERY